MAWSAEKFKLYEDEDEDAEETNRADNDRDDDDDDDDVGGGSGNNGNSANNNNSHNNNYNSNNGGGGGYDSNGEGANGDGRSYVLAVSLAEGSVVLLRSFDDVSPVTINTGLMPPLHAEWSNSRKVLAVAGTRESERPPHYQQQQQQQQQQHHHHHHYQSNEYANLLKFYSDTGTLIYTIAVPFTQVSVLRFCCDV